MTPGAPVETDGVGARLRSSLVAAAEREARDESALFVEPHHLAIALTRTGDAVPVLRSLGVSPEAWRAEVLDALRATRLLRQDRYREGVQVDQGASALSGSSAHLLQCAAAADPDVSTSAMAVAEVIAQIVGPDGGIAGGVASASHLRPNMVRRQFDLPVRRRPYPSLERMRRVSPPRPGGPLVLHGGGDVSKIADLLPGIFPAVFARAVTVTAYFLGTPGATEDYCGRAVQQLVRGWSAVEHVQAVRTHEPLAPPALYRSNVIYLHGGRPDLIASALADDSEALLAIRAASEGGALVFGMSAGAMVWGEGFVANFLSGDEDEWIPLLGWLEGVTVEAHATTAPTQGAPTTVTGKLALPHGWALMTDGEWSDWQVLPLDSETVP